VAFEDGGRNKYKYTGLGYASRLIGDGFNAQKKCHIVAFFS
jgi:hypothetical protein